MKDDIMIPQSFFERFLDKHGGLAASAISQGSISHNYIRNLLKNRSERDVNFPRLIEGDFLSGSYARGTKIYPLDDIDVMVVMDGSRLYPIKNGVMWDAEVRGSGQSDNPILKYIHPESNLLDSKKVLSLFKDTLGQSHSTSKISKDEQAINVYLDSYGLGIDIVPCFHVIPRDGSQEVYYIPEGSGRCGWIMTNPKIDAQISEYLHKHHNNNLKSVVRLLKLWNKIFNNNRLRSYHLEVIAWRIFDLYPGKINDFGSAIIYFFNNAYKHFEGKCEDITGLGDNIDGYLVPEERATTLQKISETQAILNNGFMMGLANQERQLFAWQKIFGDDFGK